MFKKFMDLAQVNKIISKQRKVIATDPDTGYSAMISALLENEAKGTFKKYPEYTRNLVNNFFVECVQGFRQTEIFRLSLDDRDPLTVSNDTVVFTAVVQQAVICNDLSFVDALQYNNDEGNLVKVLVNLKLLPERCLNDTEFDMRVA
jgi:hypothetical protein